MLNGRYPSLDLCLRSVAKVMTLCSGRLTAAVAGDVHQIRERARVTAEQRAGNLWHSSSFKMKTTELEQ